MAFRLSCDALAQRSLRSQLTDIGFGAQQESAQRACKESGRDAEVGGQRWRDEGADLLAKLQTCGGLLRGGKRQLDCAADGGTDGLLTPLALGPRRMWQSSRGEVCLECRDVISRQLRHAL